MSEGRKERGRESVRAGKREEVSVDIRREGVRSRERERWSE